MTKDRYNSAVKEIRAYIKQKDHVSLWNKFVEISNLVIHHPEEFSINAFEQLIYNDQRDYFSRKNGFRQYWKTEKSPLEFMEGQNIGEKSMKNLVISLFELTYRESKERESKRELRVWQKHFGISVEGTPFDKNWQPRKLGGERLQ